MGLLLPAIADSMREHAGPSGRCHEQTLHLAESSAPRSRFRRTSEAPGGQKRDQVVIVLATRKPSVSNRTLALRLTRTAARTSSLSLRQEPPRTTRKLGSPPRSHADPS